MRGVPTLRMSLIVYLFIFLFIYLCIRRRPNRDEGFQSWQVRSLPRTCLLGLLIMMHRVVKGEQRRGEMGRSMCAAA